MNEIAHNAAEFVYDKCRGLNFTHGDRELGIIAIEQMLHAFIQSAIEEATKENTFEEGFVAMRDVFLAKCQAESADTKRLLGLLRQVYDEHMHFGWGYEDLHDAIYKELEIAKMLPVEAVDAAMKEGK